MTIPTPYPPLSPPVQEVMGACGEAVESLPLSSPPELFTIVIIAAALRAAAEQPYEVPVHIRGDDYWVYRAGVDAERERNLAIAAELEGVFRK